MSQHSPTELRQQVLEYFWRRDHEGAGPAWTLDVASAIGASPEAVTVAIAYLAQNGALEALQSSRPTEHPYGLYKAKITQGGINEVEARLYRERSSGTRPRNGEGSGEPSDFDVFVSYASEDFNSFVGPLVDAMKARGLRVWIDRAELRIGDATSDEIDRGMRRSSYAVVVVSEAFLRKNYPGHEYYTLLDREIKQGSKVILPILYGHIPAGELSGYSLALGNKYYLRAADYSLDDLVTQIMRVVKPSRQAAKEQAQRGEISVSAAAYIVKAGTPSDALPQQPHLLSFQPCLTVEFFEPTESDGRVSLRWIVRNVGAGVARLVRLFLPGVTVDKLEAPIMAGNHTSRTVVFDDKTAFRELLKPPLQLQAEFEDHAGNLYRQYGDVIQTPTQRGESYAYDVEELQQPYLVSSRIIPDRY